MLLRLPEVNPDVASHSGKTVEDLADFVFALVAQRIARRHCEFSALRRIECLHRISEVAERIMDQARIRAIHPLRWTEVMYIALRSEAAPLVNAIGHAELGH